MKLFGREIKVTRIPLQEAVHTLDAERGRGLFSRGDVNVYKVKDINDYYEAYLNDDLVRQSVDDLMEASVGKGFYTTEGADEEVKERTAYTTKAKQIVDEFGEHFNLDDFLRNVGTNALIAGFCPVETQLVAGEDNIDKCALKIVYPPTVDRIETDPNTDEVTRIIQRVNGKDNPIDGRDLAWFCYGKLGNRPEGVSFVRGLINVLNTLNETTADVDALLDRYISPVGIWKVMGPGQERLPSLKKAVTERGAGEDIFLADITPEEMAKGGLVEFLSIDPRVPFWEYIQWLYERVYSYTRSNNLIFVRNATEASAKKMDEIVGRHVTAIQRFLKRGVERYWFTPLTELNGLGEPPRLNWGQPRAPVAEIQLERFLTAITQQGYLEYGQVEDILRQMGIKLLPRKEPWVPPVAPTPTVKKVDDNPEGDKAKVKVKQNE